MKRLFVTLPAILIVLGSTGLLSSCRGYSWMDSFQPLKVDFVADITSGTAPLQVTFTNKTTGSYAKLYWDFGDGSQSNAVNPAHVYTQSGTFTVQLIARGNGHENSVKKDSYIKVNGTSLEEDDRIKNLRSEKLRDRSPQVEETELAELAAGNTRFALDLFRIARESEKNLIFAPYSISLALAMAYGGARGETQEEMAKALHFALASSRLHTAFNALELNLANRNAEAQARGLQGFKLHVANSMWGQIEYPFLSSYLDLLAESYGAGLRLLDFRKSPEDSRLIINQWISDQTHEKIKDLLPSGSITPDVRSVLTNAIYFKAAWQGSFKREKTRDEKFTLLNGSQVIGPMMHGEVRTLYSKGDGYEVFRLPYENVELSMIILLPQIGKFETVEQALDESHLNEIIESWKDTAVILTMPKFTFSSDIGLKEKLSELGMTIAFTDAADFSGMTGGKDLTIYDVLHKAFISVDEEGTEAAAATGVIFGVTSMPETVTVVMDRPFIFLIHDRKTNTILFMGHVVNPLNE